VSTQEELDDENRRVRKVRRFVDIATAYLQQTALTRNDAERLVTMVRGQILALFPDGAETYELVYAPRFRRLIDECTGLAAPRRGVVHAFKPRNG